ARGGGCRAAIGAGGIYSGGVESVSARALWTTAYGEALAAKVALVLAAASFGAANRYAVLPLLGTAPTTATPWPNARAQRSHAVGPSARDPAAHLARYVACEAALALLGSGCTAALGQSSPPRHPSHAAVPAASNLETR